VVETALTNQLMSLKVALLTKKPKSSVSCGSEAVAAVGNKMGNCKVDAGGVGGNIVVAGVAAAAGFDAAAFFTDFFLFDGAGIVFMGWNAW
jgi:hypothetical protein